MITMKKIIPSNIDVAHYQSFEQMVEQLHHPPVNMNTVPSTTLFYFKMMILLVQ